MNTDLFWATIKPGDVINSWPRKLPSWWNPMSWVERSIQGYQKRKWPHGEYRPTHTQLYLGGGEIFEITFPKARFTQLRLSNKICYTIHRYTHGDFAFQPQDIDLMRIAAKQLLGREYDYGQLLDILLKQLFPTFIRQKRRIFDFGKKRMVCSVGVHYCLLYWWKNWWRPEALRTPKAVTPMAADFQTPDEQRLQVELPRPLGKQYVEVTAPADFSNGEPFQTVGSFL